MTERIVDPIGIGFEELLKIVATTSIKDVERIRNEVTTHSEDDDIDTASSAETA